MLKALLFESERRFEAFRDKFAEFGVECRVASFDSPDWFDQDFSDIDIVLYFPSFYFSSNHPLALSRVKDNLLHIQQVNPRILFFPDPSLIRFYNDKYRQFLFLRAGGYPIPDTLPLLSEEAVGRAVEQLGFPLVLKNRFGAGGDSVFIVDDERELRRHFEISRMNLWNLGTLRHLWQQGSKREFLWHLVKARRAQYPLPSYPLLAQRFLTITCDLKTVVGRGEVVEGHWRRPIDETMWKMNIDGGGIGEWSYIPPRALELSTRLAASLEARWLNIDLIPQGEEFLITEFSPVWHHYRYKEKDSFVYKDDYNLTMPLEESLDLEGIIVRSLVEEAAEGRSISTDVGA